MLKNIDKTNLFNGKTVPVDWGLVPEYFFVASTEEAADSDTYES